MLYLQILAFVATVVLGVLITGVGFINSWNIRASGNVWLYVLAGIPLLALGAWLPFAFGWIPV